MWGGERERRGKGREERKRKADRPNPEGVSGGMQASESARCAGTHLSFQHLGGRGRKIRSSRSALAIQKTPGPAWGILDLLSKQASKSKQVQNEET